MKIAIYSLATGRFMRTGIVPDADKDAQHREGEGVLHDVAVNPRTECVDLQTGKVVSLIIPPPTLAELKDASRAKLATRRWEIETGGITVAGISVATDRTSRAALNDMVFSRLIDPNAAPVSMKGQDGFAQADTQKINALAVAVSRHVQACFRREAEISALIESAESAQDLTWLTQTISDFWPAS